MQVERNRKRNQNAVITQQKKALEISIKKAVFRIFKNAQQKITHKINRAYPGSNNCYALAAGKPNQYTE